MCSSASSAVVSMDVRPQKICVIYIQFLRIYLFILPHVELALEEEYSIHPKVQSNVVAVFKNQLIYECTGILLDETHVLTAAHCVLDNSSEYFIRYQGDNFSLNNNTSYNKVLVSKKWIHQNYYRKLFKCNFHDVAILKLEKAVPHTLPVILASSQFNYSEGFIIKWNRTQNENITEFRSEVILFQVYDSETCQKAQQNLEETYIYENICATTSNISLELGNTGSPLFAYNDHGIELIGFLYCGLRPKFTNVIILNSTHPVAFVNIFLENEWIRNVLSSDTEVATIKSISFIEQQNRKEDHYTPSSKDFLIGDSVSTLSTIYPHSFDTETTTTKTINARGQQNVRFVRLLGEGLDQIRGWNISHSIIIGTLIVVGLIVSIWISCRDNDKTLSNNHDQHCMVELLPLHVIHTSDML